MAEAAAFARLQYLDAASRALLTTSPRISAYLQTQRGVDNLRCNSQKNQETCTCSACGQILVPGWNCKRIARKMPRAQKQPVSQDRGDGQRIRTACELCGATNPGEVKTRVKKAPKISKAEQKHIPRAQEADTAAREVQVESKPSGASSTAASAAAEPSHRRRARNKKNSLQAMLADRKLAAEATGYRLGLMDFLK